MKIPAAPPNARKMYSDMLRGDFDRVLELNARSSDIVDDEGRYLSWEALRFKKPPADLSSEEWWMCLRLARDNASQKLPLCDRRGTSFSFCKPPMLEAALRDLDMNAGGELAGGAVGLTQGEGERYLVRSLAEEPFASSFIEGAATTRVIAKKLIFENRAPRTKDERMVLNNYRAMEFVKAHKDDALTLPFLLKLHRTVTEATLDDPADAGRIRLRDDVQVVDDTSGEILHWPPAFAALPQRLEALLKFANEKPEAGHWIHPLVRAFVLHFMLSYEHPFVDGNGRVARALFYWLALREGYWLTEYVSISTVIKEAVVAYGKAFLDVESDGADLTYFLLYHAGILQTAVARLAAFVTRKRKEVEALEHHLSDRTRPGAFNHRQHWLINECLRRRLKQITVAEHQTKNSVSYLTARKDLEDLTAAGLMQKTKSGKTSIYRPAPDLMRRLTGA
jgi:Fic family protein